MPAFPAITAADPTIGRIEIPRVGVSAPILEGVDYETIRRGVGHFPETPLPSQNGNMALAAHRTTHFRGLRDIHLGDEITITAGAAAFRYRVDQVWVVNPEDVSVLGPSVGRVLTLVTCFPFDYVGSAPQRLIVRAHGVPMALPLATPAPAAECPAID